VRLASAYDRLTSDHAESEEVRRRAEELGAALTGANQQLQEQTVELEMQAEELQAVAAQLEERTEEAEAERARYRYLFDSIDRKGSACCGSSSTRRTAPWTTSS
jgi:DNA repair exonuclease SbcCD ATPase subunit